MIGSKSGFWGPSTVRRTIQAAGRESGYFVSSVNVASLDREALTDAISHLHDQSVERIVLIAAHDEAVDVARGQEAAGCRSSSWTEARARLLGWQSTMYAAGIRPSPPVAGDWTAAGGYEAGLWIAGRPEVTGVFCANDQMALGMLRALTEAGRRVPGDVSVVGFDDIPEAAYLIPPLTTVRQDFTAVGRRAIDILQAAIADVPAPAGVIDAELVVRASTGSRRA